MTQCKLIQNPYHLQLNHFIPITEFTAHFVPKSHIMAPHAPQGPLAKLPSELIEGIPDWLPCGRDLFSFTLVCKGYHTLLEKSLYARFATTVLVTEAQRSAGPTEPRPKREAVLLWAVRIKQKETMGKWCKYAKTTGHFSRYDVERAVSEAAADGLEEILEIFLENAREHVEVQDLIFTIPQHPSIIKLALKYGLDPNDESTSPLFKAKTIEVAQMLLSNGANPDSKLDNGNSVVCIAAKRGDADFIKMLARYGAKLNEACDGSMLRIRNAHNTNPHEWEMLSPVYAAACLARNTKCLDFLIAKNYFNPADGKLWFLLLQDLCIVDGILLENQVPLANTQLPQTPPKMANPPWRRLKSLQVLIEHGLDVDSVCGIGVRSSLLGCGAWFGNAAIVKLLLQQGATVDTLNSEDRTPLQAALDSVWAAPKSRRKLKAARLLVKAGACLNSFENSHSTALCTSVLLPSHRFFDYLLRALKSGANFAKNDVAQKRFKDSGEYMRATLEDGGQYGQPPLVLAAYHGKDHIVSELLKLGADPNVKGQEGASPLEMAVRHGHVETCRLLLSNGADPHQEDSQGRTASKTASGAKWFTNLMKEKRAKNKAA